MSTPAAPDVFAAKGVVIVRDKVVHSLNPKIVVGSSIKGGGRALYAREPLAKGEWVWREVADLEVPSRDWAYLSALPEAARREFLHYSYCACAHRPPRARCVTPNQPDVP